MGSVLPETYWGVVKGPWQSFLQELSCPVVPVFPSHGRRCTGEIVHVSMSYEERWLERGAFRGRVQSAVPQSCHPERREAHAEQAKDLLFRFPMTRTGCANRFSCRPYACF